MAKPKATLEPNGHGRTFVLINGHPTYLHFDHPVTEIKYIKKGIVEVDGQEYTYTRPNATKGVVDNRHRNWRRRG